MKDRLSLELRPLFPLQFFLILLLIFIAEVAAAVVALVYTTMVRRGAGRGKDREEPRKWAVACVWPPSLPGPEHRPAPPRLSTS